jgi:hypothetical protein
MTEQEQNATDYKGDAKKAAREISMLSPYVFGRTLRRWYLRRLHDHHLKSAYAEITLARQHHEAAQYLLGLATTARAMLEELEGA